MKSPVPPLPVTLRDIARIVGVSHVTVSLALRNNPKIPEARRLQIQQLAQRMGYRPNAQAIALAHHKWTSSTPPIKAAIAWLNQWPQPKKLRSYSEFDHYWRGAYAAAEKFGYRLEEFICSQQLPLPRLDKILCTRSIQGIILPPHPMTTDWSGLNWKNFSAMRFGRSVQVPRLHVVTSDQVSNTMLAFQEIRCRGYERIGFVTGNASERGSLFTAGFLMARESLNPSLQLPILVLDETETGGHSRMMSRWLLKHKPDAVLTDMKETRELLEAAGCRVPDDVGLAALSILDGNADAGIDQHPEEIGRVAMLLIISLINDNARGIPPIFRQALVEGSWVDGSTLPDRQKHPALDQARPAPAAAAKTLTPRRKRQSTVS